MRRARPILLAVAAGFAATAAWALTVLGDVLPRAAFERGMFLVPALVFPLATGWRARSAALPWWATLLVVDVWLVAAAVALCAFTGLRLAGLAPVLAITLVASTVAARLASSGPQVPIARRWLGRGLAYVAPALAIWPLVPRLASSTITYATAPVPVPEVKLSLLDGRELPFASLRGRVVVLNFWGVHCGPCVSEMPELEAVARAQAAAGAPVSFFAVNPALGDESAADVREFAVRHGLSVPIAYEPDHRAYEAFAIEGTPTTVVVDPRGRIRFRRIGYLASARYSEWLGAVIAALAAE